MIKIFSLVLILLTISSAQLDSINIITNSGPLRGKRYEFNSKFNQKPINAFIGIPYANPPLGVNRFRPPQPMNVWTTEKDVTNNRVMCPQVYQRFNYKLSEPIREDEDCLYLNIFVPISTKPLNGYPVMFYIHGGEYMYSGKDFYPPQYLLDNDVILVTINYRLGVLGFLSTGDESSAGNFGIRDQILALKWIYDNIRHFGGNAENITLFGHNSGAISVSILMISPQSWGLFHNVMIISGSVFTPNAVKLPDIQMALDFSQALNCDLKYSGFDNNLHNLSQKLIQCLRIKSVNELMSASRLPGLYSNTFQFTFGPVIDTNVSSPLIVDQPIRLFRSGNYWKTPLVAGLVLNEGSLDFFKDYDTLKDWSLSDKTEYLFSKYNFNDFYTKVLTKSIQWYYFKRFNETNSGFNQFVNKNNFPFNQNQNQDNDWFNRQKEDQTLIDAIGDYLYGSAVNLLLDLHSVHTKTTYLYVIEHIGLKTFGTLQQNGSQIIHRNQYGVTHMDDIFYLFPTLYNTNQTSSYDEPVIRTVCQYFGYFAKYGRFAEKSQIINYQMFGNNWFPYSQQNPYYLRFLSQNSQIMKGFRTEFNAFWNYFVREIFDDIYDKNTNRSQLSAQFIGTVQLKGLIRFGDNKFVIS